MARWLLVATEKDRLPAGAVPWPRRSAAAADALVPTAAEAARLLRRRAGFGLHAAAAHFGVCHVTFLRMEKRADPAIWGVWRAEKLSRSVG